MKWTGRYESTKEIIAEWIHTYNNAKAHIIDTKATRDWCAILYRIGSVVDCDYATLKDGQYKQLSFVEGFSKIPASWLSALECNGAELTKSLIMEAKKQQKMQKTAKSNKNAMLAKLINKETIYLIRGLTVKFIWLAKRTYVFEEVATNKQWKFANLKVDEVQIIEGEL